MLHDLSDPEMMRVINEARVERSREMARLIKRLFLRRAKNASSNAVAR